MSGKPASSFELDAASLVDDASAPTATEASFSDVAGAAD
jgi:hypothetical protein